MAKPMVGLAKSISSKIREKQGEITEVNSFSFFYCQPSVHSARDSGFTNIVFLIKSKNLDFSDSLKNYNYYKD